MKKREFLKELKQQLAGLPDAELQRILEDFGESIDDRMEDGVSEEEAVAAIGSAEQIADQILQNTPLSKLVRQRMKPRRKLSGWEIALLILGFPLWFPLLAVAAVLVLVVLLVLWVVVLVLYVVDLALAVSSLGLLIIAGYYLSLGKFPEGLLGIGCALIVAGVTVLLFSGCNCAAKGVWWICKKTMLGIKRSIIRKR